MYNTNYSSSPNPNISATGPNIDHRIVCLVLSGILVLYTLIQAVDHFKEAKYMSNSLKLFGAFVVIVDIVIWAANTYCIYSEKDNDFLGKLCIANAGVGLLNFIHNMQLIGWYWNIRIVLVFGQTIIIFAAMAVVILMADRVTAHKIWFVPGAICAFLYLIYIDVIIGNCFSSFKLFLNYLVFPASTTAFCFFFVKWLLSRERQAFPAMNVAAPYPPQYQQPQYQPQQYQPQYQQPQYQPQQYQPQQYNVPVSPAAVPAQQPVQKPCPNCGMMIDINDRFCSRCGTVNNGGFCSNCGAPLAPEDRFCAKCGRSV